jgi:ferric-dicitrate binding protein FerR (iron transport regulator)
VTADEFDRLYQSFASGNLDAEEAKQLKDALRDPEWQRRWRDNSDLDGALLEEFRIRADADTVPSSGERLQEKPARKHTTLRRARLWPALVAAAVMLAAGGTLFMYFRQDDQEAEVAFMEGTGNPATLTSRSGSTQAVRQGMKIPAGSSLATGGFAIQVKYAGEATTLECLASTTIVFSAKDGAKSLTFDGGEIKADIGKQPAGKPMVILTSRASIEVKGTRFDLTQGSVSTRVDMDEGVVKFVRLSDGRSLEVKSGEYAEVAEGKEFTALPRPSSVNLVLNPGFEEDGASWELRPPSTVIFTRSGLHGSKAAEIKNGKAVRDLIQRIPVQGGATYKISVWTKLQDLRGFQGTPITAAFSVGWLDSQQKQLRLDRRNSAAGTQDWKQLSGEFTAPTQATHALIRLYAEDGSGTFWFDDCEVVRVQK